jgi:hypothetical protein
MLVALKPDRAEFEQYQTIYYVGHNYLKKTAWCILGSVKTEIVHDNNKTKTLIYWDQNGQEQKKLITLENCQQFAIQSQRLAKR